MLPYVNEAQRSRADVGIATQASWHSDRNAPKEDES